MEKDGQINEAIAAYVRLVDKRERKKEVEVPEV